MEKHRNTYQQSQNINPPRKSSGKPTPSVHHIPHGKHNHRHFQITNLITLHVRKLTKYNHCINNDHYKNQSIQDRTEVYKG